MPTGFGTARQLGIIAKELLKELQVNPDKDDIIGSEEALKALEELEAMSQILGLYDMPPNCDGINPDPFGASSTPFDPEESEGMVFSPNFDYEDINGSD